MFESLTNAIGSLFSSDQPAATPAAPAAAPAPAPAPAAAPAPSVTARPPTPTSSAELPEHGRTGTEVTTAAQDGTTTPPAQRQPDPAAMRQAAADIFTAVDGMGTDEDAIHRALQGRSPAEIEAIRAAYADHYPGRTLDGDLADELSGDELAAAQAALTGDPVQAAAATLVNAASGLGTDEDAINRTLEGITDPAQRAAVAAEYERRTGQSLNTMLQDELSGSSLDVANALAQGDVAGANAARLDEAMNGTFLGIDFGTDEDAAYSAIESARTPEQRAALLAAYQQRTGRSLDTDLRSEMEGPELDVATSLVAGDRAGAAAARMAVAADGWGTDENAIFRQLEGRSQEERDAMVAAYNARYGGAAGGVDFDTMVADEMGELDAERARQLRADGRLDPVFALNYAMDGVGTDEQMIRDQLQGRSAEEIAQFRASYRERYGRDLDADLGGENSGRDGFEISQLMLGEPRTPEERLARANAAYDFERGSGAGVFGVAVTDMFSDSGHYLDLQHQRMNEIGARMTAGTATPEDLERLGVIADYHRQDVHSYQTARDSATNAAAMAGTAVVGTAVSVLTAGAASPAVVAALAALAGGGAGMAIRAGMQGASYSNEDMATDAITTLASAATAGALQGATAQALFRSIAGVAEGAVPTLAQQMTIQALQGAAGGAANGAVGGLLNEQNYQGDVGDWLAGMASSTGLGALQGGVAGVATGAVQSRFGEAPPGWDPRMWAAVAGGTGGALGGAAQTLVDPATFDGRWEDIAARFGTNMAMNAFQEAAEGANQAAMHGSLHPNARHDGAAPAVHADADGAVVRSPSPGDTPIRPVGSDDTTTPVRAATDGSAPPAHATTADGSAPPAHATTADGSTPPAHATTADGSTPPAHATTADGSTPPAHATTDGSTPPAHAATDGTTPADGTTPTHAPADASATPPVRPADLPASDPARRTMGVDDLNATLATLPGGNGRTVVADDMVGPLPPGAIRASEAQRLVDIVDALDAAPGGQLAARQVAVNVGEVSMNAGEGSFRRGRQINLDTAGDSAVNAAAKLVHEAHHAATYDRDVDINMTRDQYVAAALLNEAQAQAAALEFHRELGAASPTGGANEWGHHAYHESYDAELANLQTTRPDLTPEAQAALAREAGTRRLQQEFGRAIPSTSIETDPVTGQPRVRNGAPANYDEHYGNFHDLHSPVGAVHTGGTPRPLTGGTPATPPPATGFGATMRGAWDSFRGFFGFGPRASGPVGAVDLPSSTDDPTAAAPIDPQRLADLRKAQAAFLGSDDFAQGTRPAGSEGAPPHGVEVWGQPSAFGNGATPGHIAATAVDDPLVNASFGGSLAETVAARAQAIQDARVQDLVPPLPRQLQSVGTGQPPLPDAPFMPVSRIQGEYFMDTRTDPYRQKQTFSHVFDPEFINPTELRRTIDARTADNDLLTDSTQLQGDAIYDQERINRVRLQNEYQLMSVPLDQQGVPGKQRGRGDAFDIDEQRALGRVRDAIDPATGQPRPVAPAKNCVTDLMDTFTQMGVIGAEDFQILGGDEFGNFLPENDVTPQRLYELLRWREYQMQQQRAAQGGGSSSGTGS